jgi:hypothetical protein
MHNPKLDEWLSYTPHLYGTAKRHGVPLLSDETHPCCCLVVPINVVYSVARVEVVIRGH